MTALKLLVRPVLRLLFLVIIIVAVICVLFASHVKRCVSDAVAGLLQEATYGVASHDLAVLRDHLESANTRLAKAKQRRARIADLLESAYGRRSKLQAELGDIKTALKEIAGLLDSSESLVRVGAELYSREVVEKDAAQYMRRCEQGVRQLRDLDRQIGELKEALTRVDEYIVRAEEMLANRDGLLTRLENRAEYQGLLQEIGQLIGEADDGLELRLERVTSVLEPLTVATPGTECDDPRPMSLVPDALARYIVEE